MTKIVAIISWGVTILVVALGVTVGQTLWFYIEPVMQTVDTPPSYGIAATVGIALFVFSLILSVLSTIAVFTGRNDRSETRENEVTASL